MSDDMPDLRALHADRDRVVDMMRIAGGDGRLSAEELDTRLESALSARTLGELAGLTADLPIAPAATGKDVLVVEQHGGRYRRASPHLLQAQAPPQERCCRSPSSHRARRKAPAREGHRAAAATSVRGGLTVRQVPHGCSRHALHPMPPQRRPPEW
jgi:hypothetical protein